MLHVFVILPLVDTAEVLGVEDGLKDALYITARSMIMVASQCRGKV